jgi:hypothetical protein
MVVWKVLKSGSEIEGSSEGSCKSKMMKAVRTPLDRSTPPGVESAHRFLHDLSQGAVRDGLAASLSVDDLAASAATSGDNFLRG